MSPPIFIFAIPIPLLYILPKDISSIILYYYIFHMYFVKKIFIYCKLFSS